MNLPDPDAATSPAEKERLGLLYRIGFPDSGSDVNPDLTQALLGDSLEAWEQGLSPFAPVPLLEALMATAAGREQLIQSDLALLREVDDAGEDVCRSDAFGFIDAGFPIQLEGRVVYCAWMRRYRVSPFSDEEVQHLLAATGLTGNELPPLLESATILTAFQEEKLLDQTRTLRDRVEIALHQLLRAGGLSQQMIQSERSIALGSLSSGIAHRFNNLLSIILGYSSFVLNRESVSDEAADALRKISNSAQQGRRLTEEILAFAGSDVEVETICHVHGILTGILSLLQSQHSSHLKVELALDAAIDSVTAAPSSIHQLMFNLLTSAIDSMPKGGDLSVSSANETQSKNGTEVPILRLTITDSSGVLPEGFADTEAEPPAGLKLTQAHGIVGSLDGSVSVSSDPGETTRVEVCIPVVTGPPPESPSAERSTRLVPATIWVVDDDQIFREMCLQVLGDEGHQISPMETGREMQEKWSAAAHPPDLMIIDFSMPEYNGLELCEWLQTQDSQVPVILVSGFSETQPDIHKALQIRKTYFLRKPFSFREMIDTVTVALGETLIGDQPPPA